MNRRYRVAFLMQQVLGHATHSAALQEVVGDDPDIEPVWAPITYWREGGAIEKLPGLPDPAKGILRASSEVWRALARGQVDAVVFNSPALMTTTRSFISRIPATVSLDVTPRQFDREGVHFGHRPDADGAVSSLKHRWNRGLLARCAALAPWSSWCRSSLEADYGIDPAAITVIPPGVDAKAWARRPEARHPLPQVLFVGGDFRRKGGDLLLEWFRRHGRGRCELQIVSSDPATVGSDATDVHVHRNLRPGDPALRKLFWQSDVFVLPSRSEPFGIAAVEALAAGLPVVAASVGGLTDIVDPGLTGILVSPGDSAELGRAIDSLLEAPERRRAMSERCVKVAEERFDAGRNGRRLIDLVKASVDQGRAAPVGSGQEAAAR